MDTRRWLKKEGGVSRHPMKLPGRSLLYQITGGLSYCGNYVFLNGNKLFLAEKQG